MIMLPSIGSYIDQVWSLYHKNFRSFIRITGWYTIIVAIAGIASLMTPAYGNLPFVDNLQSVYTPTAIAGLILSGINLVFLKPLAALWIAIGLMKFLDKRYDGKDSDPSSEMTDGVRVFPTALVVSIIFTLLLGAFFIIPWIPGLILLLTAIKYGGFYGPLAIIVLSLGIIVGIVAVAYYSVRYGFALYEAVLRNANVRLAFARSHEITSGNFWPIFWRAVIGGIIIVATTILARLGLYAIGQASLNIVIHNNLIFERAAVIMDLVFTLIMFAIFTPLTTSFILVLFRHVNTKRA